jgi:hypothetical protein
VIFAIGGMRPADRPRARATTLIAVIACGFAAGAGCSSDDVTGEPEEIETLIEVVPEDSRCVHDRDGDEARFEVRLRNTGEDERTVTVTPVRRFADGDDVGSSLDGFKVTVPGNGEAEGDITVEVSDDLSACLVRIDSGEATEVELQ